MKYFLEIKNFFSKNKVLVGILLFFLCFQFFFSFLFPSVGTNDNWLPIKDYVSKYSPGSLDNFIFSKISPLFSKYLINSDVGNYLETAGNFSSETFRRLNTILNRPLYPFLIFLLSLPLYIFGHPSYGVLFFLGILINFILMGATVFLLFSLLNKFFSKKIAFLSCLLLIFSPLTHSFSSQIMPEMLTAFFVVLSFYFLDNYLGSPAIGKLIIFSLILGTLMLGKMFFAIPLFIFSLAVFYKRFKEAAIFLISFLIPVAFWYFLVTQVWGISYSSVSEIHDWRMGIWIFDMFKWSWYKSGQVLINIIPEFSSTLLLSFLVAPVVLAFLGLKNLAPKIRNIFYGFMFCVLILGFLVGFYYRHAFMLFPFIYPVAILGIERISSFLQRYKHWLAPLFFWAMIAFIIIVSEINIYHLFPYDF